jgi:signal transduction histidine kinase
MVLVMRHVFIVNYGYLYREAKQAIETKDMFTNMIAHELRAPLTAIRGYASIISEQKHIDEDTRGEAKRIEESSERLITIVSDLLDVARIQSGKLSIKNEKIDLSEVITTVLDSLQPSAAKKRITLKSEGTNGTLTITNDGKRLYQALTNLVSNAIKYTESGSITVSVEKKRDRVELRVKDTGMGIDAESQKELFAPFFRVKNEKVDIITGTGLGMWITKQLVALMGGSIGVESIKEVGTHVVITLPFK